MHWCEHRTLQRLEDELRENYQLRENLDSILDGLLLEIPAGSDGRDRIDKAELPRDKVSQVLCQLTSVEGEHAAGAFEKLLLALGHVGTPLSDVATRIRDEAAKVRVTGAEDEKKIREQIAEWTWNSPMAKQVKVRQTEVCLTEYKKFLLEQCSEQQQQDDEEDVLKTYRSVQVRKLTMKDVEYQTKPVQVRKLTKAEEEYQTKSGTECSKANAKKEKRLPLLKDPVQILMQEPPFLQDTTGSGKMASGEPRAAGSGGACADRSTRHGSKAGRNAFRNSCLVLSGAGTGKTMLCRYILAMYSDERGTELSRRCPYPVYIHCCRDTERLNADNWMAVLGLDYPELCNRLSPEERRAVRDYLLRHGDQVLFVIDGADEVSGDNFLPAECKLRSSLLCRQRKEFTQSVVLATSRPSPQAALLAESCKAWYSLEGFPSLEDYLCQRLGDEKGRICCQGLSWSVRKAVQAVPKFARLLADQYGYDGEADFPRSITSLYRRCFRLLVKNFEERCLSVQKQAAPGPAASQKMSASSGGIGSWACNEQQRLSSALLSLEEDDEEQRDEESGKLESTVMGQAFVELQEAVFQCQCRGSLVSISDQAVCFAKGIGVLLTSSPKKSLIFKHITWREYLAAHCLVMSENPAGEARNCMEQVTANDQSWMFWQFVCGMVETKHVSDIICALYEDGERRGIGQKRLLCFLMQCLHENLSGKSRGSSLPEDDWQMLADTVFKDGKLDLSQHKLHQVDAAAIGVCLSRLPIKELLLKSCGITQHHLDALAGDSGSGFSKLTSVDLSGNNLNGEPLARFTKYLCRPDSYVSTLNLAHCHLSDRDGENIARCMQLPSLTSLMLTGADSNVLPVIAENVDTCPGLGRLAFDGSEFSEACAKHLPTILRHTPNLETIFLRNNKLTSQDVMTLLPALSTLKSISGVWLQGNRIGNEILPALIDFIRCCESRPPSSLQHGPVVCVGLECNGITWECLDNILRANLGRSSEILVGEYFLHLGQLQRFDVRKEMEKTSNNLSERGINDELCKRISEVLVESCPEEILDLKMNQIGDVGACALAERLPGVSKVKVVDLAFNRIGGKGLLHLLESSCKSSTAVRTMVLGNNELFDPLRDCGKFEKKLEHPGCSLRVLMLNKTGMTDEVGCRLAKALLWNSSLVMVSVASNNLGDDFAKTLADTLADDDAKSALRRISLGKNRISDDGVKVLLDSPGVCRLECVWMHGNPCSAELYEDPLLDAPYAFITADLLE